MKSIICGVLFGMCLGLSAGDAVTLLQNDASGTSSFNSAGNWSEALAPRSGADYFVEVYGLRSPTTAAVFGGDSLTIRNNGLFTLGSTELITVTNLYLEGLGRIHVGIGGSSGGVARVDGTLTIRNTSSGYAYLTGRSNRLNVEGQLAGDGTFALEVRGTPFGSLVMALSGNNTNFTGKLRAEGCIGYETQILLGHTNALAGRMASFQPDGIRLLTNAALWAESDAVIPENSNRGVTVAPNGSFGASDGKTLRIETVVSGTSLRKEGSGRLELTAECLFDSIHVNAGLLALTQTGTVQTVFIAGTASVELPVGLPQLVLEENATLQPGPNGIVTNLSLRNFSAAGGSTIIYDLTDATQDVVTVTGAFQKTGTEPVRIQFSGTIPAAAPTLRILLRAPNLASFAASDFSLVYPAGTPALPAGTLEIVPEESGAALVFRQGWPVIRQTKDVASGEDGAARSAYWSDLKVPAATNDYLSSGFALYISGATFPGHSLTIDGTNSLLTLKGLAMTFPDLRLHKGRIHNGYPATTIGLAGSIGVYASESLPFDVTGNGNTIDCTAGLTGDGALRLTMANTSAANFRFNLKGDNSAFTGKIKVTSVANSVQSMRVGAAGNNAFGGPLSVFCPDALTLTGRVRLMIDADTVFDAANRGITIDGASQLCYFSVATGKTFRVEVPITGTRLYKNDGGNLILGAANTLNAFQIDDGSVEPRHAQGLGTNALSFAENAALRLQAGRLKLPVGIRLARAAAITSAMPITVKPVVLADETMPADIELPLFLLADGSTGISQTILFDIPREYRTELKTRSVDDNGTARTLVYAVLTRHGTMILLH